jgi:hypothetical protein
VRYFFNVSAEDETIPDLVGIELPHIEAVRQAAAVEVAQIWEARVMAGKPPYVGWLDVVDDHQRPVFKIPL